VAVETFAHKPLEGAHRRFKTERKLIFDDGVRDGVNRDVGQMDTGAPVVVFHKMNPFGLVQGKPFLRIRRLEGIVSVHMEPPGHALWSAECNQTESRPIMSQTPGDATRWRPAPTIRPIAIGVVRREDEILAMAVADDSGTVKGWRPLGGGVAFGERAVDAVRREYMEELGLSITEPRLLAVLENIYEHHGAPGHEIVFVYETSFEDRSAYERDGFDCCEGDMRLTARWIALTRFEDEGAPALYPDGLMQAIRASMPNRQ
jgi:ADP-ribose pyrophosphatase YjhB (NUDIX family)